MSLLRLPINDYNESSMRTSVLPFSPSAAPTLLGLGRLLRLPSVFLECALVCSLLLLSARRRCSQDPSRSYFSLPGISRSLLNFTLRCHFFLHSLTLLFCHPRIFSHFFHQLNAFVLSLTYFYTFFVTFFFINSCTCSHNYSFFFSWWSLWRNDDSLS